MHVIDMNASIGKRVSEDERYGARALSEELDRHRVARAVVHHAEAVFYRQDEGNRLAREAAEDRLLYGSAAPHRPMQKSLNQVLEADLSDQDKTAILGGNAMRLLGIEAEAMSGLPELASLEPSRFDEPIVDVHSHLGYWPIPMPCEDYDPPRMLARMRRFGVVRSVVSSYESMRWDVAAGNARLARAIDGHPELLGCVELELTHIPAPTGSAKVRRLMAEVAKRGRPVLFMPHAPEDAPAERELAREFPRLPIVHAHAFDADWAAVVKDAPNVHVEFCLSRPSHHDVRDVLDILGPERVLFGSDQTLLGLGAAVGLYLDARLSGRERALVLSGNARRLYGIET